MTKDLRKLEILPDTSVREALAALDRTNEQILFVVDTSRRLIRTITDGDIRRHILAGGLLEAAISVLPSKKPTTTLRSASDVAVLALMDRYSIDHIPVVDDEGRPIDLRRRRDVHAPILLSTPHMGDHELGYVVEAFDSNWIAPLGPNVDAFEHEFMEYLGRGYGAAVSSGTAGLHLALHMLGVSRGDIVFCSSFTFVASANPILYCGAQPVFIDSEPDSWNMSPAALKRAFMSAAHTGELPKAVIVVNLYGQSADFEPINALCLEYGVPIVEDAAESLGATYHGQPSGTLGAISIFSFNGNKIITTSGGGMLVSQNKELTERAKFLATQGREPVRHYEHREMAFNYRMSNVLAGIGRGQLRVLDDRISARRAIFARYVNWLAGYPITWMPESEFGSSTRWLSTAVLDQERTSLTPAEIEDILRQKQIEVRRLWKPMHRQPLFQGVAYFPHGEDGSSISDRLFDTGLCLPSGSNMSETQQERVAAALQDALKS